MVTFAELGRRERLIWRTLRAQGGLTDAQLAWFAEHLGMTAGAALSARRRLVQKGLVRFARRFRLVNKRWAQVWEAVQICAARVLGPATASENSFGEVNQGGATIQE